MNLILQNDKMAGATLMERFIPQKYAGYFDAGELLNQQLCLADVRKDCIATLLWSNPRFDYVEDLIVNSSFTSHNWRAGQAAEILAHLGMADATTSIVLTHVALSNHYTHYWSCDACAYNALSRLAPHLAESVGCLVALRFDKVSRKEWKMYEAVFQDFPDTALALAVSWCNAPPESFQRDTALWFIAGKNGAIAKQILATLANDPDESLSHFFSELGFQPGEQITTPLPTLRPPLQALVLNGLNYLDAEDQAVRRDAFSELRQHDPHLARCLQFHRAFEWEGLRKKLPKPDPHLAKCFRVQQALDWVGLYIDRLEGEIAQL